MIGAAYNQAWDGDTPMTLATAFDALVYFDVSHASQELPPLSVPQVQHLTLSSGAGGSQLGSNWSFYGPSYAAGVDESVEHSGRPSLFLHSTSVIAPASAASLTQVLDPQPYLGKRVRIAGFIKATDVTVKAFCWMRVDGPNGERLGFDYMQDRPILGSTDWRPFAIVLDVPPKTVHVLFGMVLDGGGQVWVDDVNISAVGSDVPVTSRN